MGDGEDGPEALEIDVGGADVVVGGHGQLADFIDRGLDGLVGDVEKGVLGSVGAGIDQVEDSAPRFADDGSVGVGDEVADGGGVPVIAAGEAVVLVHALLDDGPLAGFVNDEGVKVELKAIGDGVVIDASGEAAGAGELIAVKAGEAGERDELVGGAAGVAAAASADGEAEFGEAGVQATFQGSEDGGGNAGGVPVHAHDSAKGLEPEGIAEAGEEF